MFSLSGDFEAKRYLNFFEHLPTNFLVHLKIAATHTFCSTWSFPPPHAFWSASKASLLTGHF